LYGIVCPKTATPFIALTSSEPQMRQQSDLVDFIFAFVCRPDLQTSGFPSMGGRLKIM